MSNEKNDNTDIVAAILTFAVEYKRLEPPAVEDKKGAFRSVLNTYSGDSSTTIRPCRAAVRGQTKHQQLFVG